jgi:endonuclease YncB( thermonuclease family)
MFGRRKKAEGFEWHKYVRTTIKLRREARREKVDRFRRSAAEGAKAAGDVAGSMAKEGAQQFAAGARFAGGAAGVMAKEGARHFAWGAKVAGTTAGSMAITSAVWLAVTVRSLSLNLAHAALIGARATAKFVRVTNSVIKRALMTMLRSEAMRPLLDILGRPGVSTPLALAGAIALLAGLVRPILGFGLDTETGVALLFGLICLLAAYGPRSLLGTAPPMPQWLSRIDPAIRTRVSYGCVAVLLGIVAWSLAPSQMTLPGAAHITGSLPLIGGRTVEGRAAALAGDLLRIGPTVVKLAGVEVPEREQRCLRPGNRRWRCAEAAQDGLSRLTRGRAIKCDIKGTDAAGRASGICFDGATDIGAALVKGGHAFAEQGFLARYARQESQAQAAKIGLWSGEAERPASYRARTWEEAKRSAPDGCPIKGQVAGGARVYVLPWSPDYGRVRVSKSRGGRWFCSEQEAIAAGWERG